SVDSWMSTSTSTNVPSKRSGHTAVWTGTKMIIWGGGDIIITENGDGTTYGSLNTGGIYNPSSDSWTATSTGANVPSARHGHTAVWTGTKMIIWGGQEELPANLCCDAPLVDTGGQYDPSTDSWVPTSTGTNVPSGRAAHTAVWAGTQMIVWGGQEHSGTSNTGGIYNPSSDSWTATSAGANVPSGRAAHTAVWTGTQMIVWGGFSSIWQDWGLYQILNAFNTGGIYNPLTDSWTPINIGANLPSARYGHTAVWTGTEMIIWGGDDDSENSNTGGIFTP
ncbi:MAG: hypothetical protein PHN89_05270, partial [Candidatus Pacebacteria bacterium]|nr:hypothetical protein [Candidatus Paceibacterota bacterium]